MELTEDLARHFAKTALGHVAKEYPNKLDHVMGNDADVRSPRELHPCFFGSYDWHSCVHSWWTLLTVRRLYPDLAESEEIAGLANATFTAEKLAVECAYLERPESAGFERPYGWGWLLYLHLEATRHDDTGWAKRLEPLARAFAARFPAYLAKLTYPIRTGTHFNSAFALTLACRWARHFDNELVEAIDASSRKWFAKDRDCQAWEPGGDEFLSSALSEAMLMAQVLPREDFRGWFDGFLPGAARGEPATLFTPAIVSDRSDGKIAHLDGLNLSRAWNWLQIAAELGGDHPASAGANETADAHVAASLPHIAEDYMGSHWLASFALLALLPPEAG